MSKGSVLFPVNKYNIYLQVKTVQSMFHRYYLLWFLLRNEVKQSLDWFWPKIYLIFYPSFGNLTTQITIINTYILCIPLRIGSVFFSHETCDHALVLALLLACLYICIRSLEIIVSLLYFTMYTTIGRKYFHLLMSHQ